MTSTIHPLARHGTTQSERLLKSLIPENLQLDDRSLVDVLAFAGDFAKQVRFWDSNNAPDGNWNCFFDKDATVLLAIVAATDLDELRINYRSDELKFVQACREEKQTENKTECEKALSKLHPLVLHIFNVAKKLLDICQKLPPNHPLKAETQALIREKLGIKTNPKGQKEVDTPIGKLISYHKGIVSKEEAKDLYKLYKSFLTPSPCQEAWGLTPHDFNCIEYNPHIDAQDRETLWRLFLAFYKVLALVVTKAEKAFNLALHGRRDHPPHIALFLAFVLLFRRYHQADMNGLVGKHLLYYYQDVLRLQQRREIPDRVHIVFEIAQNIETYRLQKDTLLLGGKDTLGLDRLYTLTDELVINKAKLIEKQNLYFYKDKDDNKTTPIALPAADLKDGIKTPYPAKEKAWHPLSGLALYKKWVGKNRLLNISKRAFSRSETLFQEKTNDQLNAIIAKPGLIISSPELWLAKGGDRTIKVVFDKKMPLDKFYIDISTAEKPLVINQNRLDIEGELLVQEMQLTIDNQDVLGNISITGSIEGSNKASLTLVYFVGRDNTKKEFTIRGDFDLHKQEIKITDRNTTNIQFLNFKDNSIIVAGKIYTLNLPESNIKGEIRFLDPEKEIFISLPSSFPAIAPPKNEQDRIGGEIPFIRFRLKENADYEAVSKFEFSSISIQTGNNNLKNISLQVGSTQYAPTSEIPLIGSTTSETTLMLYATAPELSVKNVKDAKLTLPFKDKESHGRVISIEMGLSEVSSSFNVERQFINAETFENPLLYTVTTPYAFFKKKITILQGNENSPINLFKIPPESVSISYQSEAAVPAALYWLDFLGGYSKIREDKFSIVPLNILPSFEKPIEVTPTKDTEGATKTADGNLRLGFEALQPGQTLSLLFHFAEGTGNPDKIAPDEIVWSYLRQNQWIRIPPQFILMDETLGLRQTGIVRLQIPADINNQNTLAIGQDGRRDLYWLQVSATENSEEDVSVDALPELIDIFPQAATAVFQNNQNEVAHLENGLPAQTIAQLRYRDPNVSKVEQPFVSFDGRLPEGTDRHAYYRRIHERLRHRQRAITLWDYERIILEAFPKVAIAKCLTHTRDIDVLRPGFVTLGVVPYPERMQGNHTYYPIFNAGFLETIERYLNRHNSYFVSGQGGGVVCCCAHDADDCGCDHDGDLLIRNALFEPVRLQVCVKFRKGKDEFYYKKQLNEDLKNFLAPWAVNSQTPLLFGTKIYTVELLRFLENLDYIDVVMGLKVKHFANREMAEKFEYLLEFEEKEIIAPFTSRSVLTTYLDVLNEDNDNVIDHDIKIIEDQSCCADCMPKL